MELADPHDKIARLEAELEALAASAERCRKIAIAAKAAILGGGLMIGMMFGGAITAGGAPLLTALILLMGGTVLFGSNNSTAQQTAERIAAVEKLRADLIGAIDLRVVADAPRVLH